MIKAEFRRWCAQREIDPPNGADLGQAMADLFERVGIALEQRNGRLMAIGVKLKADKTGLSAPGSVRQDASQADTVRVKRFSA